ncbi:MAG TPA: hypothetical protein VNQ77_10015 [Frankiaceae bacterium]|nr:hypothetical protein [Frankiaceae bacterium]
MRRLAPCLALPLLLASPAAAAGPQVTDPAGDANALGVVTGAPASQAPYDVTAVRWWADASAQKVTLTFADTPEQGRWVLSWATPTCEKQTLEYRSGSDWSYLAGCMPRQRRWPKPAVVSGRTLTFSIPRRDLPSWFAAGTTIRSLSVTSAPLTDFVVGQLHEVVDTAAADVKYVVGS